jgi:hypothetical protein
MIIIVPLVVAIALGVISFLATALDPTTCISVVDDVLKVLFTLTLVTLTQR